MKINNTDPPLQRFIFSCCYTLSIDFKFLHNEQLPKHSLWYKSRIFLSTGTIYNDLMHLFMDKSNEHARRTKKKGSKLVLYIHCVMVTLL